jgi:hypothetical protein
MKLADLVAKTREVAVEYAGETVNLVVRSEMLNTDLMIEMARLGKVQADPELAEEAFKMLPELLCKIVASWDLEGDDGKPFPLVPSKVSKAIPVSFLSACIQGATQSLGESAAAKSGESSDSTSLRVVR